MSNPSAAHSAATSTADAGSEYDQLWQCGYCNGWHVVPSLARDCERKHEDAA